MVEQIQKIPLDQIDAPKIAMRSDVHDEGIDELAQSIQKIGLLQPVLLRPMGERYEVIAGHRRVVAARLAGLVTISAIVREPSEAEATVYKIHENLLRRDVNPVDEAAFLAQIMREQDLNIAQIVELTRRSTEYIVSRLAILEYPDYLVEAVGEKQISLAAAGWLNKISDEQVRKNYVGYAISGGISVKRAIAWHDSWKAGATRANPMEIAEPDPESGEEQLVHKEECMICQTYDVPAVMILYYAHSACVEKIAT